MARGWRWGARPLVPASAEEHRPPPGAAAGVLHRLGADAAGGRQFRAVAQAAGLKPLIWSEVSPQVSRAGQPRRASRARSSSRPTTPRTSTPRWCCARCRRPGAARRWSPPRPTTSSTTGGGPSAPRWSSAPCRSTAGRHDRVVAPRHPARAARRDGWSLLIFPEGTRSPDGQLAGFKTGAARLAMSAGVPIVPIGIRGSYAAMPRGRAWPVAGRPQVSVRFGAPMRLRPDENAKQFTDRIAAAITQLCAEDPSTWWESIKRRRARERRSRARPPSRALASRLGRQRPGRARSPRSRPTPGPRADPALGRCDSSRTADARDLVRDELGRLGTRLGTTWGQVPAPVGRARPPFGRRIQDLFATPRRPTLRLMSLLTLARPESAGTQLRLRAGQRAVRSRRPLRRVGPALRRSGGRAAGGRGAGPADPRRPGMGRRRRRPDRCRPRDASAARRQASCASTATTPRRSPRPPGGRWCAPARRRRRRPDRAGRPAGGSSARSRRRPSRGPDRRRRATAARSGPASTRSSWAPAAYW